MHLVEDLFEGMHQNYLLGAKVESDDQSHFFMVGAESERQKYLQKSGNKI